MYFPLRHLLNLVLAAIIVVSLVGSAKGYSDGTISQKNLEVLEVKIFRSTGGWERRYYLAAGKLDLDVRGASAVAVTSCSFCSEKPGRVIIDGEPARAVADRGLVVAEDMAVINFTRLGIRASRVTIELVEKEPKPPAYVLLVEEDARPINMHEVVKIERRGDLRPWGAFVLLLSYNLSALKDSLGGTGTLVSIQELSVETELGRVTTYQALYLVSNATFRIRYAGIIRSAYRPIYYVIPTSVSESKIIIETPREQGLKPYLYLNSLPLRDSRISEKLNSSADYFSKIFTLENPRVFALDNTTSLELGYGLRDMLIEIVQPDGSAFVGKVVLERSGVEVSSNTNELEVKSSFTPIDLKIFKDDQLVSEYTICGYADRISLVAELYRVGLLITDLNGERVSSAEVEIYRDFKRKSYFAANGFVDMGYLASGEYLVRVTKDGLEVSRSTLRVTKPGNLTIVCELADLDVRLFSGGEPIPVFTSFLEGANFTYSSRAESGVVHFEDIPTGHYKLRLKVGGSFERLEELEVSGGELTVTRFLPLTNLTIKLLNSFGSPIKGLSVMVLSENGSVIYRGLTDSSGRAVTGLLEYGNYTVEVPQIGIKKVHELSAATNLAVIRTDIVFLYGGIVVDANLASIAFLTLIVSLAIIFLRRIKHNTSELIVLERD